MAAPLPVNQVMPPWGTTDHSSGETGLTPDAHLVIQHPNNTHEVRPAATPWGDGRGMAFAGRARHHPFFSAPGGLYRGVRK